MPAKTVDEMILSLPKKELAIVNRLRELVAEGRRQVKVMYFHTLRDIKEDMVRALLFEAGMIDDSFGSKKQKA